jgi:hypothetical protein
MPRYSFHVENGGRVPADLSEELPSDEAALNAAHAIARDLGKNRTTGGQWRVIVTDEAGAQVATVPVLWTTR